VAAIAVERGCGRLNWAVLDWNTPAIDFYRAMGAEFMDEWRIVRVTDEALERLSGAGLKDAAPSTSLPHPSDEDLSLGTPLRSAQDDK
jgi:hypothetical protein